MEETEDLSLQRKKYKSILSQIQPLLPQFEGPEIIKQSWSWFSLFSQSNILQHKYNVICTNMTLLAAVVALAGESVLKCNQLDVLMEFMKENWKVKTSKLQKLSYCLRRETKTVVSKSIQRKNIANNANSVQYYVNLFCEQLKINKFRATHIAAIRKQHQDEKTCKWIAAYILINRMVKTFSLSKNQSVYCVSHLADLSVSEFKDLF